MTVVTRAPCRAAAGAALALLLAAGPAAATEVRVMNSGGFSAAYKTLAPGFEKASGDTLETAWGPSMGTTKDAIPVRLARGEKADVLIMVGAALDAMIADGRAVAGSKVDLARSKIGMVVRAGAPKPDIHDVEAFKKALIAAKSIAYSDSASGVYVGNELYKRLGIADEVAGKSRMIPAEPVAQVVARGEAEIGFQQVSELLPIPGADFVGTIPEEVQKVTLFSAGIAKDAPHPDAGRALIRYLAAPEACPAAEKSGLEPIACAK